MIGLRAVWGAIVGLWEELFVVMLIAVPGFVLLFPLVPAIDFAADGSYVVAALILLVALPIAAFVFAGHYALAHEIAESKAVRWRTWWNGARRYWRPALAWLALYMLILVILVANLGFYGGLGASWGSLVQGVWLTMMLIWVATNLFVMPLYLLQTDRRLKVAYRNAALMTATDPLTMIVLLVVLVLLFAVLGYIAVPLTLILPPFSALLGAYAVRYRLQKEGLWQPFHSEAAERATSAEEKGRAPRPQAPVRPRSLDDR